MTAAERIPIEEEIETTPDPRLVPVEERRCAGINADGSECRTVGKLLRWNEEEEGFFCLTHSPDPVDKEIRASARQRGAAAAGERVRKGAKTFRPGELGKLESREDARRIAGRITVGVLEGRLSPEIAREGFAGLKLFAGIEDDDARKAVEKKLAKRGLR